MKTMKAILMRRVLTAVCALLSCNSVIADDEEGMVNLDYFRTPEASAFMRYGGEAVNEYTGTADITVPLYTIRCKDIEIPIALRYDASGIKVEQEASWVGLGWNLPVGGCINYVCAGGHDMLQAPDVPNEVWTEYLTSEFSFSAYGGSGQKTQTRFYKCNPNEQSNWMASLPLRPQDFVLSYTDNIGGQGMREYVDWGYGERDFYSVSVMGKSFMFFIDPFTLKVFNIGKGGEDFTVEPEYVSDPQRGIGNQSDVQGWTIKDSDGYVYRFEEGDKFECDIRTGIRYTSCWYLTRIQSPMGETAELTYGTLTRPSRKTRHESFRLAIPHEAGQACCANVSQAEYSGYPNMNSSMYVTSRYLTGIRTGNQTVTFATSGSNKSSGRKLDAIEVASRDGAATRTFNFSYGSFGHSDVGGNYAPDEDGTSSDSRLRLESVREIAFPDTLTTRFSYNQLDLPSRRSCAQDYWGYYNGCDNNVSGRGYSMLPTPRMFMSSNYSQTLDDYDIGGADRLSRGSYMQAAMLNRVDYPTGGHTTYEYEPNSIQTSDYTLIEQYEERPYDVTVQARFAVSPSPYGMVVDQVEQRKDFTLSQMVALDLSLRCSGSDELVGEPLQIQLFKQDGQSYSLYRSFSLTFLPSSMEFTHIQDITLSPGNYFLLVIPVNVGNDYPFAITCKLNGWYGNTSSNPQTGSILQETYSVPCGGLRVHKISDFNNNGAMVGYTTYDYDGGVLLDRRETIDYTLCYNLAPVGGLPGTHHVGVYTIGTGHPHLPAFYACCNPGTVGYSKVTKSRYGSSGNLENRVVTSYSNNGPQNFCGIDIFTSFTNGQVLSQEIRDASDAVVARTVNTYTDTMVDHYATNMMADYKCLNHGPAAPAASQTLVVYDYPNANSSITTSMDDPGPEGIVDVRRYPYILSRSELSRTVSTEYCPDSTVLVKTRDYLYNGTNHQVSRIDESTSIPGRVLRTAYTYSADAPDYVGWAMKHAHRLNDVLEKRTTLVENGQERPISTRHTTYGTITVNDTLYFLPTSYSTAIGGNAAETRATYSYDGMRNVRSVVADDLETVYLWSYHGQYPVARIEGLTYAEVEAAVGAAAMDDLLHAATPGASELNAVRNAVKAIGGIVTTYTYKPLVGIESETQPNGNTIHYEYDGLGRLTRVIDQDGNVVSTHSYNYRKP